MANRSDPTSPIGQLEKLCDTIPGRNPQPTTQQFSQAQSQPTTQQFSQAQSQPTTQQFSQAESQLQSPRRIRVQPGAITSSPTQDTARGTINPNNGLVGFGNVNVSRPTSQSPQQTGQQTGIVGSSYPYVQQPSRQTGQLSDQYRSSQYQGLSFDHKLDMVLLKLDQLLKSQSM